MQSLITTSFCKPKNFVHDPYLVDTRTLLFSCVSLIVFDWAHQVAQSLPLLGVLKYQLSREQYSKHETMHYEVAFSFEGVITEPVDPVMAGMANFP